LRENNIEVKFNSNYLKWVKLVKIDYNYLQYEKEFKNDESSYTKMDKDKYKNKDKIKKVDEVEAVADELNSDMQINKNSNKINNKLD